MTKLGRRLVVVVLVTALATVLFAIGWAGWAYRSLNVPYAGWEGRSVDVDIRPGMNAAQMLVLLDRAGVIRHPGLVKLWLQLNGGAPSLQAGEYRFDAPGSAIEVLERLERGDVLLHAVTIREGLDLEQTAAELADAGFGPVDGLLAVFRDPQPIREIDPDAPDLEGYLFPETYFFPRGVAPETVARALVDRFRETVGDGYGRRAESVGLSLREAVTLASMIERETSLAEERERISRVFHNRLARSMKLQCDPTVVYALKRVGREPRRLTYRDLEFESPFNTYYVRGLPPGPIANPGAASLDAAVSPGGGDDLYFVATPDGGHTFSETLEGHLEAVKVWRRYSRSSR